MKSKCSACNEPYEESNMVQCDVCKKWLHYRCVGVDDSIYALPWKCVLCGGDPYPKAGSSENVPPIVEQASGGVELPTVAQLISDLEKQQRLAREREDQLQADLEEERNTREKLVQEYEAVKRLVIPREENQNEEITRRYRELQREQSGLEHRVQSHHGGSDRQSDEGSSNDPPPKTTIAENALLELATLMKQSHVEALPKFSGNVKDWPLFLAVFTRTTKLASIDGITNVGRLTKALEGEARAMVLDQLTFGLSPENIIETLKQRYGREEEVLRTLSTDLLALPPLTGLKDPRFESLTIALKTYVAQLKSLGMASELSNNYLESMLVEKLAKSAVCVCQMGRREKSRQDEEHRGLRELPHAAVSETSSWQVD